jgi:hypothetical protein
LEANCERLSDLGQLSGGAWEMELADEFDQVLHQFEGTLSPGELTEVREFVEAREYALALETLCGIIVEERKPITPHLYAKIRTLGDRLTSANPKYIDAVAPLVL